MLPQQLQELEDKLKGKRVMMTGGHPWQGEIGTMARIELFPIVNKYGFVVELDNGTECTAFDGKEVHYLPEPPPKKRR